MVNGERFTLSEFMQLRFIFFSVHFSRFFCQLLYSLPFFSKRFFFISIFVLIIRSYLKHLIAIYLHVNYRFLGLHKKVLKLMMAMGILTANFI